MNNNKNRYAEVNFALNISTGSMGSDLIESRLLIPIKILSKSERTMNAVRNRLAVRERMIKLIESNVR